MLYKQQSLKYIQVEFKTSFILYAYNTGKRKKERKKKENQKQRSNNNKNKNNAHKNIIFHIFL